MDGILLDTLTLDKSETRSNSNEELIHTPQSASTRVEPQIQVYVIHRTTLFLVGVLFIRVLSDIFSALPIDQGLI